MKKTGVLSSIFCFLLSWASMSLSQQVAAPVYKQGDWWKIKVEVQYATGISISGKCEEIYSEYMVKVDQEQKKVYGIEDEKQEQLDCPTYYSSCWELKQNQILRNTSYTRWQWGKPGPHKLPKCERREKDVPTSST